MDLFLKLFNVLSDKDGSQLTIGCEPPIVGFELMKLQSKFKFLNCNKQFVKKEIFLEEYFIIRDENVESKVLLM